MMQYLKLAQLVLSLLPLLINVVKSIEEAIPGQGKGEEKLAMIRSVLESTYAIGGKTLGSFSEVWPALEAAIGAVVAGLNNTGVFKK